MLSKYIIVKDTEKEERDLHVEMTQIVQEGVFQGVRDQQEDIVIEDNHVNLDTLR